MSPARFHRAVQLVFLLFMAWVGWRFFLYARWAMGQSEAQAKQAVRFSLSEENTDAEVDEVIRLVQACLALR